ADLVAESDADSNGPGADGTADRDAIAAFEADIAAQAEIDPERVIVDVPSRAPMVEGSARILVDGSVRRLADHSALVGALETARAEQWRLGVYAPAEAIDAVGRAAVRVLGLDLEGARISETPRGLNATLAEFREKG
ncbi:MAG: hypothetical protein ABEJ86_00140, partial [Halococcoides sp.]